MLKIKTAIFAAKNIYLALNDRTIISLVTRLERYCKLLSAELLIYSQKVGDLHVTSVFTIGVYQQSRDTSRKHHGCPKISKKWSIFEWGL